MHEGGSSFDRYPQRVERGACWPVSDSGVCVCDPVSGGGAI